MSVVRIQLKLKNNDLNASLRKLAAVSDRLPCYIVNKACSQIAWHTKNAMPVASPARIDADLGTAVTLQPKRGGFKRAKRTEKLQSGRRVSVSTRGGAQVKPQSVPLAALIIHASVLGVRSNQNRQPGMKRYNQATGMVWARPYSPFYGKTRAAGREAMRAAVSRLIKARRSASGFFKLGAEVVNFLFYGVISGKAPVTIPSDFVSLSQEAQPYGGKIGQAIGRVAGGTPARENQTVAIARFWVSATEPDTKGRGGAGFNKVARPVWQASVDKEAASIRSYAEKLYAQSARSVGLSVK